MLCLNSEKNEIISWANQNYSVETTSNYWDQWQPNYLTTQPVTTMSDDFLLHYNAKLVTLAPGLGPARFYNSQREYVKKIFQSWNVR